MLVLRTSTPSLLPTPMELLFLLMSLLWLLPVLATLLPREEFIKNRKARTMIVICAILSHCNQCEFCSNYQKIYKVE